MHRGDRSRLTLHDLQMHQNLARALFSITAAKLIAVEVHQAHICLRHESFRDERRSAERNVITDPNRDVASIAIHIFSLPESPPTSQICRFKS